MSKYRYTDKARAHLHELAVNDKDYAPLMGTTTIINEIFPPPLAWYGSAKALERLGWITEKKEPDAAKREELLIAGQNELRLAADMNLEDYHAFLEECYRAHDEHKKAKGKEGTDIHKIIESYIKECIKIGGCPIEVTEGNLWSEIRPFIAWAIKDVQSFLWSESHCFSEKLWLGGITDFGFVHKNGQVIVADNKPSIYPKNFIQTAAYGLQIEENGLYDAEGNRLPIDTDFHEVEIDGYCIFDYNKGEVRYRTDVERLEAIVEIVVDLYKNKDVIGTETL